MLHAYDQRFDVMENLENFYELNNRKTTAHARLFGGLWAVAFIQKSNWAYFLVDVDADPHGHTTITWDWCKYPLELDCLPCPQDSCYSRSVARNCSRSPEKFEVTCYVSNDETDGYFFESRVPGSCVQSTVFCFKIF